ncbi:T6SS phospholipase effector Tle1-like catalytic domain-containing protein [Roseateles sp. BYS87W]|uniref:Phospholipase effector Tle1 domain-containing protein n=1 Tax=Pelomonas baiyunensis TaxID=3299026 RepID=A0ABW7H4E0_9BURK
MKNLDPSYIENQVDSQPGLTEPVSGAQGAQTARRAPGQRSLSAKEREQRQLALGATVPTKEEAMCQCTKVLHFGMFFDGTGNNRNEEMAKPAEKRALSNVAKLWAAHQEDRDIVRRYVPGLGTPYAEIGDSGGMLGNAIGKGGEPRIKKALKLLDEELAKVPKQQKVLLINLTVFGFSRGAALARAFVRDLAQKCETKDEAYEYQGIPIRVAFAGLFDTVCSAYDSLISAMTTSNGGHNGWAAGMTLPPMVEQSVHMNAAHEQRRRFPLDSTRIDARYPDNTVEIWYPGVHSDVGGGYAPQFQGRNNGISRFALNHMFDLAFAGGVLFNRIEALDPSLQDEFNKSDPALREAYNAYIDAVPVKTGPMEEVQAAHMLMLHRWHKKRALAKVALGSVQRLQAQRDRARGLRNEARAKQAALIASVGWQDPGMPEYLDPDTRARLDALRKEVKAHDDDLDEAESALKDLKQEERKFLSDIAELRRWRAEGKQLGLRDRTLLQAWDDDSELPEQVQVFFDTFAHDSVAHFNYDTSRLTDWRTIYFGGTKYKPT